MAHSENATIIEGNADLEQLVVRAHSTQTNKPLVVEQSDGTDVFTVSSAGAVVASGDVTTTGVSTTGGCVIDGSADEIQLRIQGHSTQTTDPLVVENSSGTDVFNVSNAGNTTVAGTLAVTGATTLTGAQTLTGATAVNGHMTIADAKNIILNTTTGTIIGTATGQKVAFHNATPVVQAAHIADPSGGGTVDAEARTAINAILVVLENKGFTATS